MESVDGEWIGVNRSVPNVAPLRRCVRNQGGLGGEVSRNAAKHATEEGLPFLTTESTEDTEGGGRTVLEGGFVCSGSSVEKAATERRRSGVSACELRHRHGPVVRVFMAAFPQ